MILFIKYENFHFRMQLDSISNGFQLVNTIPSLNSVSHMDVHIYFDKQPQPQPTPSETYWVYECKHPIELGNIFIEKWTTKHHLLNISTSPMKKRIEWTPKNKIPPSCWKLQHNIYTSSYSSIYVFIAKNDEWWKGMRRETVAFGSQAEEE